ncbi:MAG: hypothetical protein F7B18_07175 [Desulfurococcales archaeon]|nr:hypothetical protein [Desulfurococcales archaeon]
MRSIAAKLGIEVVPRIHIVADSPRDLPKARGTGLVVVEPTSLEAARKAAVMKSIRVIRVSPGMQRIVDRSTARLLRSKGGGAIELSLRPLIRGGLGSWRWFAVSLRRAVAYGIDVVLVSDAETGWDVWHPRHVEGLAHLAGVPQALGLTWISNIPRSLLAEVGNNG